ncbi:MAG: hypothetical protein ACPGO3_06025 [Magnetospiraceae bacterium]
MANFLKDAVSSLFLDKKARDKLAKRPPTEKKAARAAQIADIKKKGAHLATPERQELIQQALKAKAAKQQILEDLSDEQRRKLYALAVKSLLKGGQ